MGSSNSYFHRQPLPGLTDQLHRAVGHQVDFVQNILQPEALRLTLHNLMHFLRCHAFAIIGNSDHDAIFFRLFNRDFNGSRGPFRDNAVPHRIFRDGLQGERRNFGAEGFINVVD